MELNFGERKIVGVKNGEKMEDSNWKKERIF